MRKFLAAALCATMVTGAFSSAALAEDTKMPSIDFDGADTTFQISVSADGESFEASLQIQESEAGDATVSGSVTLPPMEEGAEAQTIELGDVLRVVSGDIYFNVDGVLGAYQDMTGDASLTSLTAMVGIDQPWLVIPKLDLPVVETEEPEVDEEMVNALLACMDQFEVEETESGFVMSFDKDSMIAYIQGLEAFESEWGDSVAQMFTGADSMTELDYKTIFADYIQAAAEGLNAADSTIGVEDAVSLINTTIDSLIAEVQTEMESMTQETGEEDSEQSLADQFAAAFGEDDTVNGTITVEATEAQVSLVMNMDMTVQGETAQVSMALISTNENGFAEVTAPEAATPLRDVVKNGVMIYYSMMMQEAEAATDEAMTGAAE